MKKKIINWFYKQVEEIYYSKYPFRRPHEITRQTQAAVLLFHRSFVLPFELMQDGVSRDYINMVKDKMVHDAIIEIANELHEKGFFEVAEDSLIVNPLDRRVKVGIKVLK
jgi:hypothetical protein